MQGDPVSILNVSVWVASRMKFFVVHRFRFAIYSSFNYRIIHSYYNGFKWSWRRFSKPGHRLNCLSLQTIIANSAKQSRMFYARFCRDSGKRANNGVIKVAKRSPKGSNLNKKDSADQEPLNNVYMSKMKNALNLIVLKFAGEKIFTNAKIIPTRATLRKQFRKGHSGVKLKDFH